MRVNSTSDSFDHYALLADFKHSDRCFSKSFDPSLCLATRAKRRARLGRQAMRQAKQDEMQSRAEARDRKQQDRWGF